MNCLLILLAHISMPIIAADRQPDSHDIKIKMYHNNQWPKPPYKYILLDGKKLPVGLSEHLGNSLFLTPAAVKKYNLNLKRLNKLSTQISIPTKNSAIYEPDGLYNIYDHGSIKLYNLDGEPLAGELGINCLSPNRVVFDWKNSEISLQSGKKQHTFKDNIVFQPIKPKLNDLPIKQYPICPIGVAKPLNVFFLERCLLRYC